MGEGLGAGLRVPEWEWFVYVLVEQVVELAENSVSVRY
jgi:hypothetical protein